jgi:GH43 family beta-xylosidase
MEGQMAKCVPGSTLSGISRWILGVVVCGAWGLLSSAAGAAQAGGQNTGQNGASASTSAPDTFTNPLLPSGADPWVTFRDGYYYYMNTTGDNLTIWKTRDLTDLRNAPKKVVWTPPASGPYSHEVWAPELHFLDGKWYIYFAADAGNNDTHRLWVVENDNPDPQQGEWTMKGQLKDATDKWAIDPTVFRNQGKLYVVWSGWSGDSNGVQNLYIAQLQNPWTIGSPRVQLSTPTFPWEKVGDFPSSHRVLPLPHVDVNEGPEILKHNGKIFLVYSASGCWTNYYELGMLTAEANSDLLDPASWKKSSRPVFWQSPKNSVYGTGHNSFFQSPDGTQDWILYHANSAPDQGCGDLRSPRMQPFTWNPDGSPDFGRPLPTDTPIAKPSGTAR